MAKPQLSLIPRKYVNQKNAAAYCGYGVETFRKYEGKYSIPRKGPDNSKYSVEDLDRFMENPHTFCMTQKPRRRNIPEFV
ncbi:hypothetical protein [Halodesulfovibrio marinisediminis]|uniref:Uncharacterized protein n=1 Tax=Halodesulfovibrio marinisediminis DSM 17456 TaxID=1121457 RepID=A0A1N6IWR5_9BACT|nr:hypothetical protein [Halodesulfovibrio marinisediminis]SIO36431.1 hypothetical protein SAMN02745161_3009 [Halodesulfovibrio marinisediminis DSM 17456]